MKTAVLKDNRDFQRLYSKGKKCVSGTFVVYYCQNSSGTSQIGITAGKKLGNAVARNRVRRQVREVLRLLGGGLSAGYDVVIVVRSRAVGKAWQEINGELCSLLKSCGLICHTVSAGSACE